MNTSPSRKSRILDGFRKLFPEYGAAPISNPLKTELVVAMCNVVYHATHAYTDPELEGFTDMTLSNQLVQYLDYDCLEAAVDGVVKIHLKKALNVADSDYGWGNMSDPYVIFGVGDSCVRSATIDDTANPVWDSTHYLIIRKQPIKKDFDGKLHVALFDDDSRDGSAFWKTVTSFLDQDDLLGSTTVDLETIKKPGQHVFAPSLKKSDGSIKNTPSIEFTTEYLTFKEACKEMGVDQNGKAWIPRRKSREAPASMINGHPTWIQRLGKIELNDVVFINVPGTDTQVWVHANTTAKVLMAAFRGTEQSKMKDVMLDLMAYQTKLKGCREDRYIIKADETLCGDGIHVHNGFLSGYESIREALIQVIYDVTQWGDDWNICLTGHSLGGALATMCAFELAHRKNAKGKGPEVGVMTYGAPRVGNTEFAKRFNLAVRECFRVVEKDDVVHLVPPFYTHTAKEVLVLPNGKIFIEGVPIEEQTPDDILSRSRELQAEPRDSGSLEEIFSTYAIDLGSMAEKHLMTNYRSIVFEAARKFFS